MTKKQKKMLSRILISAVLFLLLYTVPAQGWSVSCSTSSPMLLSAGMYCGGR